MCQAGIYGGEEESNLEEDEVTLIRHIIHLIGACTILFVFTNGRPFVTLAARFPLPRDAAFTFIFWYLL
jgi:hypothetical protein